MLGGIVFVMISNLFRILQPQTIRQSLDLVYFNLGFYGLLDGMEAQQPFYHTIGRTIVHFGLLVIGLAVLMGLFMYLMRQTLVVMSRLIEYDLRKTIFAHYQKLDTAFYRKNNTGDLMARITEDVGKVRMYVGPAVLYGVNLVSIFCLVVFSMWQVNSQLTLLVLIPLPILSFSIFKISNQINKRSTLIQQQLAKLNVLAQEQFTGIRALKSYAAEGEATKYFDTQTEEYRLRGLNLARVDAMFGPLMVLMIGLSTIITVYVGGIKVINGEISPGNIAEFVIYVYMLTWPVTSVGWIASLTQQASASQQRINEFLLTVPAIKTPDTPKTWSGSKIEFRNVSLTYANTGLQALENVSFTIEPGEKIAIIGKTGSGKTTIAELLTRMYDPTQGEILVGGINATQLDLTMLRRQIGYVPQDIFLFSDTIQNNIRFGKEDATDQDVKTYAGYASIHTEIEDLPLSYQTVVGERGVMLSGGQKQRISIARALIKKPAIALLDDCLSAVDTRTEKNIMGYFNQISDNQTLVLITHRLSGLEAFDRIFVFENGRLIAHGPHAELVNTNEYYQQQWIEDKA
jgi:ATP-binding cassette, subfamily B, multidrug efflux pump